jgi:glycosyltransferase involved in cell wall biosynthesis
MGVPWSLAAKVKRGMRRGFYLAPEVMKLAAAFPEVLFVIMGDHGEGMEAPANVKFLGRLDDMNQVYSWISVYLRLLRHDSLSAMVLETLARGRYVVYSKEFPFTEYAENLPAAHQALERLLDKKEPNVAGAEVVRAHYSLNREARTLRLAYSKYLSWPAASDLENED